MKHSKILVAGIAVAAAASASADLMDRAGGIKVGERLTLRPYVSIGYTYDSNVDSSRKDKSGSSWTINPGVGIDYAGDNWGLKGAAYYTYHAYHHYSSQLNSSSFGENLAFDWHNSAADEKGWTVTLSETYQRVSQDDDMSNNGGRGIGRDYDQVSFNGVIERRINQRLHAGLEASYYYLDYDNNVDKYAAMYGWQRSTIGGEMGYMYSRWLDLLVAASYHRYWQENDKQRSPYYSSYTARGNKISDKSEGWSLMGGFGSRATERITYRALVGWSRFDYGDGAKKLDGWTYQLSGKWQISNTLNLMVLGSSYYQPSETHYGTATKTYTFSTGLAKALVRGKVRSTLDLSYRKETAEYTEYETDDYDSDYYTGRFGLNYTLNRFLTAFSSVEYQFCSSDRKSYDYDRWRLTLGLRMAY